MCQTLQISEIYTMARKAVGTEASRTMALPRQAQGLRGGRQNLSLNLLTVRESIPLFSKSGPRP